MITQDYLEGLGKQVFLYDYLLNGLFPCQSDIVKGIRAKKKKWDSHDKFEYRMLLSNTNTGGSISSQVFKNNVSLIKPGKVDYGIFHATFGTVEDGFMVDMMKTLNTQEEKAAFENDYALSMHSLRMNVTALFKNFAIHGRFGVVHQIRTSIPAPTVAPARNPVANVHTPVLGTPFTIAVPRNVFNSNFKRGKYLIKTKGAAPWAPADVSELYMVVDSQPTTLTLIPVGTTVSDWNDGDFLEVQGNREVVGMSDTVFHNWDMSAIVVASGPFAGQYDQFTGTGTYTSGANAVTGAMEGIADLIPWYTDPVDLDTRLGLDLPFRDQPDRMLYTAEQAGQWILQREGQHIIDVLLEAIDLTRSVVSWEDAVIWINPITLQRIGYEESTAVQAFRDNLTTGPIIYQRGIDSQKGLSFQVGNTTISNVIQDMNMPTDVILVGPRNDLSYNCYDNPVFEIEKYIQDTYGSNPPPKVEDMQFPKEFVSSLDIEKRIIYGQPTMADGDLASFTHGNTIRHVKNQMPVAMQEMGALFTEYPYCYTVCKLRDVILRPSED